jgi:transposase InsO family protein
MSERRACTLVAADRTMIRYRSHRPPDTALRARLRELANERRRFGYRRLFILLRREGEAEGSPDIRDEIEKFEAPPARTKAPKPASQQGFNPFAGFQ